MFNFSNPLKKKSADNDNDLDKSINEINDTVDNIGGVISAGEEDTTNNSIRLRKVPIIIVSGLVVCMVTYALASNITTKPKTDTEKDLSLSTATDTNNPAKGLPSKYSDIKKYNKTHPTEKTTANGVKATPVTTVETRPATYTSYTPQSTNSYGNSGFSNIAQKLAEAKAKAYAEIVDSPLSFDIIDDDKDKKTSNNNQQNQGMGQQGQNMGQQGQNMGQMAYSYSNDNGPGGGGNYTLNAGTVITATLLTGITSDSPNGDVVAQVRQDVYDSLTGNTLLIPQGSRLIGTYGSAKSYGNERIGVTFERIILPDGRSIQLPKLNAIDGTGYQGLSDIYNSHTSKALGAGFLSAIFSGLAQSSTGYTSGTDTRSPGEEAVSGAAASILQTGNSFVNKNLNVKATVEIEPGFQFSIFVNKDLTLGEYND